MSKVRKVLIFPAGTEIGLEIHAALINCKEVELFAAGQSISNHAQLLYDDFFDIPSIHDEGWLDKLIRLVEDLNIDYIFPAYDDVIVALSQYRERIPAVIVAPAHDICVITRSKRLTYEKLKSVIKTPKIYQGVSEVTNFPVFVKPDIGQGSFGAKKVNSYEELRHAAEDIKDPIILEYLPGKEFTIDCFSDREVGLLYCGARERLRMRNGIAVSTQLIDDPRFKEIAEKISETLKICGAWFFQVKESLLGELTLLEIGPRIAGSMAANRVRGINFPLLSIFEAERIPLKIIHNDYPVLLDRSLKNKYKKIIKFDSVYIDFDDTILLKGELNLQAIQFLYKCINKGISITLITRHAGELDKVLQKYRLTNLFDRIVHLRDGEKKSAHIEHEHAIFIDDSFSERLDVSVNKKIITFDCSMLEFLLDQ